MNKVTVSIIGSGATRDPFNPLFNRYSNQFFEVMDYQFQTSMISLMSAPIAYQKGQYDWKQAVSLSRDNQMRTELNKRFLNDIVIHQPDYILMDFYADLINGIRPIKDGYITNNDRTYRHNKVWDTLEVGEPIRVVEHYEQYEALMLEAFDRFVDFCKVHLPNTKLIINRCRFASEYYDEISHELEPITSRGTAYYDDLNEAWEKLEAAIFKRFKEIEAIAYEHPYYAEPNFRFGGMKYIGYTNDYYHDFQDKFLIKVMGNLQKHPEKQPVNEAINYVQNPDFKYGMSSWTDYAKAGTFTIENGSLHAKVEGLENNAWRQMASDAVAIHAHQDKFVLQFDFEAINLEDTLANDALFMVRTYDQPNKVVRKDAVEQHVITKGDILRYLERGETKHFETELTLEGKYAKLIPYVQRNGEYRIEHIALSKKGLTADEVTPLNER